MRTILAESLLQIATSMLKNTRRSVALIDRSIDTKRALDELYWIAAYFNPDQDFNNPESLAQVDAWEAKNKNALIYDSTLVEWLQDQLSDMPSRPAVAQAKDGNVAHWSGPAKKWSPGNQRRFCLCVARILTMRQMRVDAHEEMLHDLTQAQQQLLDETLRRFSERTSEEERYAQQVKEGAIRLTEERGKLRTLLDDFDRSEAKMQVKLEELNVHVNTTNLRQSYEKFQKGQLKMKELVKHQLAMVDIMDQNYLALVQRGEALERILNQAEFLRQHAEQFSHLSTALRHQMQGQNILYAAGIIFAGGLLLSVTGGVVGTVPMIGGVIQSTLSSVSYYVYMLSYSVGVYGAYHYYWRDVQDIQKLIMDRIGRVVQDAPQNGVWMKSAHWIKHAASAAWNGVSTVVTYLTGATVQVSRHAYEYMLKAIESDARARMQQEFLAMQSKEFEARSQLEEKIHHLQAKCTWQEQLLHKYQIQYENSFARDNTIVRRKLNSAVSS